MFRLLIALASIALLAGCAGPSQLGFSKQEWQSMSPQQQQQVVAQYHDLNSNPYKPETIYDGPNLYVNVLQGQAAMPPFDQEYSFEATAFNIEPGQCQSIGLYSVDTSKSTTLHVCYDGLHLALDPSRYDSSKRKGSVFFAYNPIWQRGFTYSNVQSTGYTRLKDAQISIKAMRNATKVTDADNSGS